MKRSRDRAWWIVFSACALGVVLALAGVTIIVLGLERERAVMRAEADRAGALRLVLWRMDSWLAPHLGREAARPAAEYRPFHPASMAYTRLLNAIEPGDVLTPSSLLTFTSEFFPLHFQVEADGRVTSPQVPEGNERDLAEASYLPTGAIETNETMLARYAPLVSQPAVLVACTLGEQDILAQVASDAVTVGVMTPQVESLDAPDIHRQQQLDWSVAERQKRAANAYDSQLIMNQETQQGASTQAAVELAKRVEVGALIPLWAAAEREGAEPVLLFVRRVSGPVDGPTLQGFVADWPRLRAALLEQAHDLFPHGTLMPFRETAPTDGEVAARMLGAIPVVMTTDDAVPVDTALPLLSPVRLSLGAAWVLALAAMGASALTLRSVLDAAHRRNRFASAVTHELRTPLTTFRMYSEMLADGMVPEPERQRAYHVTLREEARRLSALVENVLAYARVEDGRARPELKTVSVADIVSHAQPALERIAADAGANLRIDVSAVAATRLITDADAVGQVLINLVDNAAKYGCSPMNASIEVSASVDRGRLSLSVRDHGAGVSSDAVRRIFNPFERGHVEPGTSIPGVGLGLSISRELAATLGGTLAHHPPVDGAGGAWFVLTLPLIEAAPKGD